MADDQQNINQNDQVTKDLSLTKSKEDYQALILALQKGKDELEAEKAKSQEAVVLHEKDVATLEADLASKDIVLHEKDTQITELTTQTEGQTQELITSKAALESAVGAYKDVVLKANPLIPTDLIQGLTIDEVNASLEKASNLVAEIQTKIQTESESKSKSESIPTGAPQRTGPDLSSMTTKEKINYGLDQARKE